MPTDQIGEPPLKVALDTTYAGLNRTGVGIYSHRLAAHLRKAAKANHLRVRCYGPACREQPASGIVNLAQEWPVYTHGLLPLRLTRFRPNIVHSTSHIGPLWLPSGKLIVTVHDLIFMRQPQDYNPAWLAVTRATLPRVLARAAAIIADSRTTADDIARFFNVSQHKVRVIYPGVDSPPAPPPGKFETEGVPAGAPYILCIGPWVRRKNLGVVLEAFERAHEAVPDMHLIITGAGTAGVKGQSPQELVAALTPEARQRTHCLGFVERDRLYALLRNATVLAYPSRVEGFGLPPLEAMSVGTPVVCSAIPVLEEVTAGAALTAPPDDARAWTTAFLRLLSDPNMAEQLRTKGYQRSQDFTWERCAAETVALYREVAILE